MIYLGNQAVGVAVETIGSGCSVKHVTVPENITLGDELGNFISANIQDGQHVLGFSADCFGESNIENQHVTTFEATKENGALSGYFTRLNSNTPSIYMVFSNAYAAKLTAGEDIVFIYKEVTA